MDDVGSGKIDIYAELGVAPDAPSAEITKRYRQLALRYHPDKNPSAEAATKFHFYSQINSVLQDPALRRQYDDIRRHRSALKSQNYSTHDDVESQILQFREQLRAREAEVLRQNQTTSKVAKASANVEVLAMRGLRLRRELQARLQQKSGYVLHTELVAKNYTKQFILTETGTGSVEVTWKYRLEPEAQIDAEQLGHIMARFGPVKASEVVGNDGRYVKGKVAFEEEKDAKSAVTYNYKSAQLWHGTPFRKLASLLRSARACEAGNSHGEKLSQAEIYQSVDRLLKQAKEANMVA